ncbi:MAG: GIY-YIG nuclease family protein [Candidatus Thorarchaeota archaeon]|nr:GIY-YIG nuclease family protein [Candidatus Thorarchaeota archaeon]
MTSKPGQRYFVYIIETDDGTYYTGQTNDLLRRFREHMSGAASGAAYLRMHKPMYLVYLEEVPDRKTALAREREIKRKRKLRMSLVGSRRDLREVVASERDYR